MKAQLIVTAHAKDGQVDACLPLLEDVHFELDAMNVMTVGIEQVDGFCLFEDASDQVEAFFDAAGCVHDDGTPCGSANREALESWVLEIGHDDSYGVAWGHRGDDWGFVFIPAKAI